MSRLSVNDVELRYPSQGEHIPYFSLKADRETKQIRFLYNTINDIYFDIVHDVTTNGRTQSIACLNSDGANPSACPMCAHHYDQRVKLYIPVLDLSDGKVKIWTRTKGFIGQLQALASRNNPISGVVVEVTRCGAPRDPKTTYVIQPISANDGKKVEDLGVTIPDPSAFMRQMDYNQMNAFATTLDGTPYNAPVYTPPMAQSQPVTNAPFGGAVPNNSYVPQQPYVPQVTTPVAPTPQYIGSEPVRRQTSAPVPTPASVPTYSNNVPTTPMQGVPTMPVTTPMAAEDDLPF